MFHKGKTPPLWFTAIYQAPKTVSGTWWELNKHLLNEWRYAKPPFLICEYSIWNGCCIRKSPSPELDAQEAINKLYFSFPSTADGVPRLLQHKGLGPCAHAAPAGWWGARGPGGPGGSGAARGEGAPAGDSRGAGLPGLRKARVPRGRLGLGVGAGGGGAAQRDPGWKPRGAPRPSRGVFISLGWRGSGLGLLAAGNATVHSRRRWALGGPRGQGPRRLLRGIDSRWGGAAAQTQRCPRARAGAGAEPPGRPVRGATGRARGVTAPPGFPLGGAGAGMPGRLAPSSDAAWGAKEEGIEVGLAGRPSEPPRSTPLGAGTRDLY